MDDVVNVKNMKLTKEQKNYLKAKSVILWIEEEKIKNEQGNNIDFRNHLFQYDVFRDMSPKQVIYKPAQVGFSTLMIFKTFHLAANRGMDIIYTLPTMTDVKDFVGGKVNRLIAQNPCMQAWTADKDSIEQKRVKDNVIYYRGTWTEKAAMMVSSDLNVYDEVDTSKQSVIDQYSTRLQHSKHGWEWFFSHPSVPGNGVSRFWDRSDQKHWFITCSRCSKDQYMSWPDSIDLKRQMYICKHCGKQLSEEDRRRGRWVNKFKNKEFSGYWINLMMCPWVPASKIIQDYNDKTEEQFYNKVLGLPYVGSGNVVTQDMLWSNLKSAKVTPQEFKNERLVIGVDTGVKIWYVVGNKKRGLFHWAVSDNYDGIEKILKNNEKAIAVFDQGGDLVLPRMLRKKYPGRVFLCHYAADRKTLQRVRWGTKHEAGNVIVDRNRMIQHVVDEFKEFRMPLVGKQADWWEYWLHWKNIYRMQEENALGVLVSKWERSGDDHLVHATVYWKTGMEKFGAGEGEMIGIDDEKFYARGVEIEDDGTIRTNLMKDFKEDLVSKFEY